MWLQVIVKSDGEEIFSDYFDVPEVDKVYGLPHVTALAKAFTQESQKEQKPVLTQEQVDESYRWADNFIKNHVKQPGKD